MASDAGAVNGTTPWTVTPGVREATTPIFGGSHELADRTSGRKRALIPIGRSDLSAWPQPDRNSMTGDDQEAYDRRRRAIEMYAAHCSYGEIFAETEISEGEVRRYIGRCLTSRGTSIAGWFGCVPNANIMGYEREASVDHQLGGGSGGCAGALTQFFDRFPDIKKHMRILLFPPRKGSGKSVYERRITFRNLNQAFLEDAEKAGVKKNEWPFNTDNQGYKSLREWAINLGNAHPEQWVLEREGESAALRLKVGTGTPQLFKASRPFVVVQLDYQKVDCATVFLLKNSHGTEIEIHVPRWYYGILVDENSHAILGAFIGLESNPTEEMALETIHSSVFHEVWGDGDPRHRYNVAPSCFPQAVISELRFYGFAVLKVDNGWANLANNFVNNMISIVGCAVNFGPFYAWWRRSRVENVFKQLTNRSVQRTPSSYGSGPDDPRRSDDPAEAAAAIRLDVEIAAKMLSDAIREYNMSPSAGLNFSTPIEALQGALAQSRLFPSPLPLEAQKNPMLRTVVIECRVAGSLKQGRRPYFELHQVRYTNNTLAWRPDLIGKTLLVYVNILEARDAYASVKVGGEELGKMVPSGPWSEFPHSLRYRISINRAGLTRRGKTRRKNPNDNLIYRPTRPLPAADARQTEAARSPAEVRALIKQVRDAGNYEAMAPVTTSRQQQEIGTKAAANVDSTAEKRTAPVYRLKPLRRR